MEFNNQRIAITHNDADMISIAKGKGAYCGKSSSEIAFFLKDKWVVKPVKGFAEYWQQTLDTAIYPWVPNELIDSFLDKYADMPCWYGDVHKTPECWWVMADLSVCSDCDGHALRTSSFSYGDVNRTCVICDIAESEHN